MKFAYVLSALAGTAVAAPLNLPVVNKLPVLSNLDELLGSKLPIVSNLGDLNSVLGGLLGNLGGDSSLPLGNVLGSVTGLLGNLGGNLPTGTSSGAAATPSAAVPSGTASVSGSSGKVLQDLAPKLNDVLTVTGPNAKTLLLKLSPEVAGLVSGLGLPQLGVPLGGVVASASSVGDLVTALGPQVEGLVTVVAQGVGALAIQLSPEVAGLVSGLGLPGVGTSVGTILATVGDSL
ncbi:hypothetical protein ATEIFO6365_0008023500 [Aspergillus terreus]|uniref:Uncharacterized protein n=1 Tax=Aspergillus terreus TaxID=33178 RepID=A0A5M3Z6J0_ASPTE|nr:hypothetical protein ATETN484_0010024400 [Aspergillus terreus]GFF18291.1 hypothetical protein ATEIFO6365_0008023500 [Aspergillus terreus]